MPESTGTGHRAITLDVGLPTLGEPFRGHVLLARRIGLSDDEIRDAVRLAAELCGSGHGLPVTPSITGRGT